MGFMTVEHSHRAGLNQARKEGMAEGIELGLAEGEARGAEKFAKLADILLDAGRIDDLKRASNDAAYRDTLFQEFHL